jgi:hypothetical protein
MMPYPYMQPQGPCELVGLSCTGREAALQGPRCRRCFAAAALLHLPARAWISCLLHHTHSSSLTRPCLPISNTHSHPAGAAQPPHLRRLPNAADVPAGERRALW